MSDFPLPMFVCQPYHPWPYFPVPKTTTVWVDHPGDPKCSPNKKVSRIGILVNIPNPLSRALSLLTKNCIDWHFFCDGNGGYMELPNSSNSIDSIAYSYLEVGLRMYLWNMYVAHLICFRSFWITHNQPYYGISVKSLMIFIWLILFHPGRYADYVARTYPADQTMEDKAWPVALTWNPKGRRCQLTPYVHWLLHMSIEGFVGQWNK